LIIDYLQATMAYGAASMLTTNGRCKTLDSSADGYVRAESIASVAVLGVELGALNSHAIKIDAIIKV
jgi:acyl transferase domain-containing protein